MAETYGKLPSEIVIPDGSLAERQMFDVFIFGEGLKAKKQ